MGIQFKEVNYRYRALNDKDRVEALHNINLNLEGKGEFIFICGQTGSGKTTLVQHMNALLQPSSGEVSIFDSTVYAHKKNTKLNAIRKRVGLVFQFPEYQLFEETNLKDIMFGPRNFGLDKVEAEKKARFAAELVGIDEALLAKSPFKISGGQMRRIAIAGILAMEPEILVLDEPTRGLDPQGQKEIMGLFHRIHSDLGKTIVVISHDMDLIGQYAKRVIVMKDGNVAFDGDKDQLFSHPEFHTFHLEKPSVLRAIEYINESFNVAIPSNIYSLEGLIDALRHVTKVMP